VDSGTLVAVAFAAVLVMIGWPVALIRRSQQRLQSRVRDLTAQEREQSERLRVLAEVIHVVTTAGDVRAAVCSAARILAEADRAFLIEPDGQGNLATTAVAGEGMPPFVLGPQDQTVTWQLMASPEYLVEADLAATDESAIHALGGAFLGPASSAVWVPIPHSGGALGLLGLLFGARTESLSEQKRILLEAIAAAAAGAIQRDDLTAQLALVADRDPLTGLLNRRRWDAACSAESARATRTGARLSFVLVELKNFPDFSERFGQLAGEGLLRQFASSVQNVLREEDTIAHWGGAVFAVALPACSAQDAGLVVKRIRDVVPPGQACTVGIAEWSPGKVLAQVMAEAEKALSEKLPVVATVDRPRGEGLQRRAGDRPGQP
jgi:diguanylate cyclase (GGDEF)-like protein